MPITLSREEITLQIQRVVDATDAQNIYIRIVLTRGEGEIGLDPALATNNNLIIITKALAANPTWWYEKGVHMVVAQILRNSVNAVDPNIKSGNYLNNVLAISEAKNKGAFDAIMLNAKGQITEATTSNIWIVKDNILFTPPIETGLLGGITRKSLIEIARDHGYVVKEENFNADQLKAADECFLTSTTKMIVPITKIDNEFIANGQPGTTTQKLLKLYKETFGI